MHRNVNALPIPGRQRGFTIVEIVVAFIIIGILTLVMTPVLTNRANDARENAALQDAQRLGDALERAAIDTGYMYRLYVLNDGPGGDGIPNALKDTSGVTPATQNRVGGVRDNAVLTNNLYVNPYRIFITTKSIGGAGQDYLPDAQQLVLFTRMTGVNVAAQGGTGSYATDTSAETKFNWNGPYVNWSDKNDNDWPDDPWGNDYLFFTQRGVIYPPLPNTTDAQLGTDMSWQFQSNGPLHTINGAQVAFPAMNIFDRPTVLSLGPNGLPGDGDIDTTKNEYGMGDDIVYSFGGY